MHYLFLAFFLLFSCSKDKQAPAFKTRNVVVLIMDGARYTETWGDSNHTYIPHLAHDMAPYGTVNTAFYNGGPTYTLAGHSAVTTGVYQEINNSGQEYPKNPGYFQVWLRNVTDNPQYCWIVTSKDKLVVLGDCADSVWKGVNRPTLNCGKDGKGLGSGLRPDSLTCAEAIKTLDQYHPRLTLISFMEPDIPAHGGVWANYIKGIRGSDEYIYRVWHFLQTDKYYKGTTTVFVTNDHGRHSDGIADGFVNHGDNCDGCRHIEFFASGPDIKKNCITDTRRELIDLPVTIAYMMGVQLPLSKGQVMTELFRK